jgi:hypothetical protein
MREGSVSSPTSHTFDHFAEVCGSLSKLSEVLLPCASIMETDSMKYRLGELQNISHGRDAHVGFNILNAHGAPIVMFSYLDRADAIRPER